MANNIDQPRRRDGSPAAGEWTAHVRDTSPVAGTLRTTGASAGADHEIDAVLPNGQRVLLAPPAAPDSVYVSSHEGTDLVTWVEEVPYPPATNPVDTNPRWMREIRSTSSYTGADAYNQIVADNAGTFPTDRAGFVITDPDTGNLTVMTIAGQWDPQHLHTFTNNATGVLIVDETEIDQYPAPDHTSLDTNNALIGGRDMSALADDLNDIQAGKSYVIHHNAYNQAGELIGELDDDYDGIYDLNTAQSVAEGHNSDPEHILSCL